MNQIEKRQERKKIFISFIMPLLLLTIRLEIESIYKNTYPMIMTDSETEDLAMRLISGCITEILDPKLYYSRFSFLESGKEAIDIKHRIFKRPGAVSGDTSPSPFLPNVKSKFYTRSTLVKNLFPMPSEGKVRAMFIEPPASLTTSNLPRITKRSHTLGGSKVLDNGETSRGISKSPMRTENFDTSMMMANHR